MDLELEFWKGHYSYPEYPEHGLISANPAYLSNASPHLETKTYEMEIVSDNDSPSYQVPRPIQYGDEETHYSEKTICFTPKMVHSVVKAALEYVSQMPSDINNIIEKLDQELNRMSDAEITDGGVVKKQLYPLDSKSIFQLLNKPSDSRTNLVLKYEMPSMQEPHCRDALEKLIEIAYNAYLELDQHPQCREYLYRFASHQPEDRPTGHLDYGPDLKSLIASILDQIDKTKPVVPDYNRYRTVEIETPVSDIPRPQIHEVNIPKIPKIHDIHDINIQKYPNIHDIHDLNIPKIPKIHDVPDFNVPKIPNIHDGKIPQIHEFDIPQESDYSLPLIHEYDIPESNIPNIHNIPNNLRPGNNFPSSHEYNIPKIHEYIHSHEYPSNHPSQIHELAIPQVHEIDMPEIHTSYESFHKTNIHLKPEETMNIIIKLLNEPHPSRNLFDRLMRIVEENPNNFHPKVFKMLLNLLTIQKHNSIPRFNDIILLLLDSQRSKWPWGGKVTESLLSYLTPDQSGNLDTRIVDIILNLSKKPTNEKRIEYILSLLRPLKDGSLGPREREIIVKLINSNQNNVLNPEYIDILLNLLKPSQREDDGKEADIIDNLSRWNEMGLSPKQLDVIFTLLKPYVNGNPDTRPLEIVHFLLTQNRYLSPNKIDFILSFLYSESGIIDARRIDIIHFLLMNALKHPKHVNILLSLLQDNGPSVLNSRFLEILLFLNSNRLLTPELVDTIINLLTEEITGQVEDQQVKTLFYQLAPLKQTNPKLVVDILTLLNQGGLHGNLIEWLEKNNNYDQNQYRTPDGGYQPDNEFMSIFKWLESQGLLQDQNTPTNDLVNKILKVLEMGNRDLGVVELTYMLKHEKPLIYQPVYYVKYRLPILSFISNMKTLLMENPQLTADPMKLIQELIIISNVTEVSPNLQGYPKEEIMKLTFNDGDLVQAKILDKQNVNLNEQITYVHGLNTEITPEEILQLNRLNEAKYYKNTKNSVLHFRGAYPEKIMVDKVIEFPQTVRYQHVHIKPTVHQTHKTRHMVQIIGRTNANDGLNNQDNQNSPEQNNAQELPQN